MKKRMELDLKNMGGVEGNQAMSQSRCERTFGFPVGKKKKKACQSPECNQEALCCNGWYDSDFPLLHSCTQADEKETQKLPQTPFSSEHVTPTDSFCESAFTASGKERKFSYVQH